MMELRIELRTVYDELVRLDELNRQRFCGDCTDSAEARCSKWRLAFEKAAARGDRGFMACANCAVRWTAEPDIDHAVRGWMLILSEHQCVGTLCSSCAASNPEPMTIPAVAERVLSQSRGPIE